MYYTYIIECADHTLYTGYTNNLENRIEKHNEGKAAKYTRVRTPVKLIYYEEHDTKSAAMKRENDIKRMIRQEKLELVNKKQSTESNMG